MFALFEIGELAAMAATEAAADDADQRIIRGLLVEIRRRCLQATDA